MLLKQALELHKRGIAIFPVSNTTKTPLVEWGGKEASMPTEQQIREWFSVNDRSIGAAMGPVSGLLLVDFDFAKHPEARKFYEEKTWPRTWKERTKSGGIHLYFRWSGKLSALQTNTTSKLFPGVDTKGHGGYSKISPSQGYCWLASPATTPLAEAPEWLIAELAERPKEEPLPDGDSAILALLESIEPGNGQVGRTPVFIKVIGRLKHKGLLAEEAAAFLRPWADKHGYEGIERLVADQYTRYPAPKQATSDSEALDDFLEGDEAMAWVCEPYFGAGKINLLVGLSGTNKTWAAIDLAIEAARGGKWLGQFPTKEGRVLYIDQERGKLETKRRFKALCTYKGVVAKTLRDTLKIKTATSIRINLENSFQAFRKEIDHYKPDLIIIDSLKTFHTLNITSNMDMQLVMEQLKSLREEFGCAFVLLHHENGMAYSRGRDKREVTLENVGGAGPIKEAPESVLVVAAQDKDSSFLHHVKNNCGVKMPPCLFSVKDVDGDKSIKVEVC